MPPIKRYLLILLLFFCCGADAYQPSEGNVGALIGPFFSHSDFESSESGANSPYVGGFGLIATGDLNRRGSLEIAIFYMPKYFALKQEEMYLVEKIKALHVTMGYRFWFNSVFSASVALFSAYPLGEATIVHNDFASAYTHTTSAKDVTEYGFDFAVEADLVNRERWALVFDVRYSLSVTPKEGEKANHYGALLGLRYIFLEKQIDAATNPVANK